METTDYCNYDLSLALKACGFYETCDHVYCKWFLKDTDVELLPKEERNGCHICADAPTLWQAAKWLREKWDLHIDVYPVAGYMFDADDQICEEWNYWTFDIMHVMSTRKIVVDEEQYGSYEEALTEGIKSALELITKGE